MRLIDADKLDWWYKGRPIRRVIDEAPTVDAVPVVRCKDCKKLFAKPNGSHYCRRTLQYAPSDGFCSYGERKADENE